MCRSRCAANSSYVRRTIPLLSAVPCPSGGSRTRVSDVGSVSASALAIALRSALANDLTFPCFASLCHRLDLGVEVRHVEIVLFADANEGEQRSRHSHIA